jgi:SPP1 family predicted phage head-tail adaptor
MSLEAGRLRHRVRIESLQYLLDSHGDVYQNPDTGETRQEWTEVATVWAAIEPVSGREFIQSRAIQAEIVARIVTRYRDGLTAAMRLVHVRTGRADVIYSPHAFLADKESGLEYLTIPCSTGVSTNGQ